MRFSSFSRREMEHVSIAGGLESIAAIGEEIAWLLAEVHAEVVKVWTILLSPLTVISSFRLWISSPRTRMARIHPHCAERSGFITER